MKNRTVLFSLVLIFFYNLTALSQENLNSLSDFPVLKGSYLGQKPPTDIPELFAPGIISTDAFEFAITFSNDGNDIFFTRRPTHDGGGNSIFHTNNNDKNWTKPRLAPFAKKGYIELAPFCSPDEQKVYFHSEREHPESGKKMTNDEKIWYSTKKGDVWSEAKFLKGILNTGWVMGIAVANSGNFYLCGEVDGSGGLLSSVCVNGNYPAVKKCFDGVHPYISPREDYIIYDVILENWEETELNIRFKNQDGDWGKSIRLPSIINATKTESFARVSPEGKYLFFQRKGDIYWVDFNSVINYCKDFK